MRSSGRGDDAVSLGDCEVIRATDAALLVRLESGDETWIPRSVIHDDSEIYDDITDGELVVKKWFADKEGLA